MHIEYADILSRITEEPIWWLNGVPRFEPFRPDQVNIYGMERALVHTECQGCGRRYDVAVEGPYIKEKIAYKASLNIGDPPNACCHVGPTMNSLEIGVLQYWERASRGTWERLSDWERPLAGPGLEGTVWDHLRSKPGNAQWSNALDSGNFGMMVEILKSNGCELAERVAQMLDAGHRRSAVERTIYELKQLRLKA